MNDINEKINLKCKFRHNEKVKIKNGYYRNYKGYIKDIKTFKDIIIYNIELIINDKKLNVWINENDLKGCLF